MTHMGNISPVIDRLETALSSGNIPPPYDRWGGRLLSHLTKPVQVVVTGLPGSGKTALLEMLSGHSVSTGDLSPPIMELSYGERQRTVIERRDGSVQEIAGALKDIDLPADVVRARQEIPTPRLACQDFIEIGLTGNPAENGSVLDQIVRRADIVLWCSQDFNDAEQQLWAMAPDHIKDHSFLVLTKADKQMMRGVLPGIMSRLEPVVAEEFLGMCPVATIQGITAQTSGAAVDDALWASSGGQRLMNLVLNEVRQGRAADIDQGRVFLERLSTQAPMAPDASAAPPSPAPAPHQTSGNEPVAAKTGALLSEAVDLLQKQAGQMLDSLDMSGELNSDAILNGCVEAVSSLGTLMDRIAPNNPAAQTVRDDLQDGEEMLVLFQLERGEDAALDAVTLLLQMRKELIEKAAG
ncbi:hypothetical protein GCM10011315_05570 [Roseovarius pacificus]|uniref:hypothetical protein n=1 Tax=Roseovarius pacificus TaxID=337701 RepID=UPI00135643A9|nr:hypothetical protein [Roseovarius pacificus]GGO51734.1 hypothetical protein GCM10011315_05570 [Roseovarius pacificus]